MDHIGKFKALVAMGIAILSSLWGWFGWLWVAWVFVMALDYYTGSRGARRRGEWTSEKARNGRAHKSGELKIILLSLVMDWVVGLVLDNIPALPFQYTVLLSPVVLVWYILTEAGSVLENVEKDGGPIPPWLHPIIDWLKGKVDEVGDSAHPPDADK
jgi:phage-related holin